MSPSTQHIIDIIIPTRGRGALIDVTISSIRQSRYENFMLWIVDQSDDDATHQAVLPHMEADPRVRYIHTTSRGSSIARNIGAAATYAPYIAFTDDDCRIHSEWLGGILQELMQNGTWAVFGRVVPDPLYTETIPDSATPVSEALPMALSDAPKRRIYTKNRFNLSFGHGANMGFNRARYEELNGFDELLGAGGPLRSWPERDLGYRILKAGGRIVYTPYAVAYHRHWRGWKDVQRTYRNYAIGTGAAVGKYLRCGDLGGLYLLFEWFIDQGARQVLSGLIKWQSWQKMQVGFLQLIYPWVGLLEGWRYKIDRNLMVYEREA